MLLYLLEPVGYAEEALPVGEVEDDDDAVGALVVGVGDGAVALLARRVPNLKFDRALVDGQRAEAEVDADRADVVLLEAVVLHTQKAGGRAPRPGLTAKRMRRQDLPTCVSPIKTILKR